MREVILVAGPPCAGKTTYVTQHAQPGDIVLDQDLIGPRAMRQALARLPRQRTGRVWVIRCAPGPRRREQLATRLRADRVHLLVPPKPVLLERATRRPNPRRCIQAINNWFAREQADTPPHGGAGDPHGGAGDPPSLHSRDW